MYEISESQLKPSKHSGSSTLISPQSIPSNCIKIAFANAIGKVGSQAQTIFYPLPFCKDKLISRFFELTFDKNSIMIDSSKKTLMKVRLFSRYNSCSELNDSDMFKLFNEMFACNNHCPLIGEKNSV